MKKANQLLFILCIGVLAACFNKVDPMVDSLYSNSGRADTSRNQAILKLYDHYANSDKTKEYYEVISKGNYIINYYAAGKLLTVCYDPGSGWGGQYNNVDEATFQKMVLLKIKLDEIQSFVIKDSLVDNNQPYIEVKTNGYPN